MKNYLLIVFVIICSMACNKTKQNIEEEPQLPPENDSALGSSGESSDESIFDIKFMTFNIRHGAPYSSNPTEEIDLKKFADVINFEQPDIVGLQEVDSVTGRAPIDEAKKLGELTNMYYMFFKAIDYDGGKYGVGILSRHPIEATENINLPRPDVSGEARTAGMVTIRISGEMKINFISTHLDVNQNNRLAQVEKLTELSDFSLYPLVLGGDLNATFGSEEINKLQNTYTFTCNQGECPFTIPSNKPNKTIDFIMLNSEAANKFEVINYNVVETEASDHLPFVTTLRVKK